MNTYDKTSLYQLSYAFMRRFAFIPVPVPDDGAIDADLIGDYTQEWYPDRSIDAETLELTAALWTQINNVRTIGPAIVKDIVGDYTSGAETDLTDSLIMYVMPQLEGLSKAEQRDFVREMDSFSDSYEAAIDVEALEDAVSEYFDIAIDVTST